MVRTMNIDLAHTVASIRVESPIYVVNDNPPFWSLYCWFIEFNENIVHEIQCEVAFRPLLTFII